MAAVRDAPSGDSTPDGSSLIETVRKTPPLSLPRRHA
jgi:hypothetical protein